MPLTGTFPLVNRKLLFSLHWEPVCPIQRKNVFRRMLKHPQLSIPLKCYFPQIVWFTVNEFSLPIIIWRSFRPPPRHRALLPEPWKKIFGNQRLLLLLGEGGDLDIPRPVNGGNYQLIKETSNYDSHCFFGGKHFWKSAPFVNDEQIIFKQGRSVLDFNHKVKKTQR